MTQDHKKQQAAGFQIEDCVVIGDRRSDNTLVSGAAYVEVPTEGHFNFHSLIPNNNI